MEQNTFLFKAKDHLVSQKEFNIYWDEQRCYANTEVAKGINLEAFYKADSYSSHKTEKNTFLDYIYSFVQKLMLSYKAGFVKKQVNNSVLDYGAGVGVYANFLKEKGYAVSTVEPSETARKACVYKGLVSYKAIDQIPNGARFSSISLWHVLEHLPDPNTILLQLNTRLDPKGRLIIAVPNLKSYDAKYYKHQWAALDVPRHLWHFTSIGLIKMVEENNFMFQSQHPLWFDSFYISYMSEAQKGASFPFVRGVVIGFLSNIKALFNGEYSSKIYVFEKKV